MDKFSIEIKDMPSKFSCIICPIQKQYRNNVDIRQFIIQPQWDPGLLLTVWIDKTGSINKLQWPKEKIVMSST